MTTMNELRTIECKICHLDAPVDEQHHGVCFNCVDNIEHQEEYATEMEKFNGRESWDEDEYYLY